MNQSLAFARAVTCGRVCNAVTMADDGRAAGVKPRWLCPA